MLKYCILDLETNGVTTHKRFCNPLDQRHTIQCHALKFPMQPAHVEHHSGWLPCVGRIALPWEEAYEEISLFVGQNFKFDMLWFWQDADWQEWLISGGKILDTQTVQYLLDGQEKKPRHLDDLARKYGGVIKDDRIKTMYQAGMQSKDIDPDLLIPYALGDANNTEKVFLGQLKTKNCPKQLIKAYMDHYLAVTEIEYNGMHVDVSLLKEMEKTLINEIDKLNTFIIEHSDIKNPASSQQVSEFVFGDKKHSSDEKNLKEWLEKDFCGGREPTLKNDIVFKILELREKNKLLTTYVNKVEVYKRDNKNKKIKAGDVRKESGLLCMVHEDGCIHSEYQTAYTASGRLSSRSPNMQNIPPAIMDVFDSRWDDGYIMEADFSQLEVCVAAQLSQDSLLIEEIKNGVDMHRRNAAFLYNCGEESVTSAQRKTTKVLTFALLYGASARRMSVDHKLSEEDAQRFIDGFYNKYIQFKEWHDKLEQTVKDNAQLTEVHLPLKDKSACVEFQCKSFIKMPWGKKYIFKDMGARTKRGDIFRYWPSTDIKNYPVQGTASDVVALMVGRLWRKLLDHRHKALLINEVHDSIILDIRGWEHIRELENLVKTELCDIESAWKEQYGLEWNVPLSVDIKVGKTWLGCKDKK